MLGRWEDAVARKHKLLFYLRDKAYISIMPSNYGFLVCLDCSFLNARQLAEALEIVNNE